MAIEALSFTFRGGRVDEVRFLKTCGFISGQRKGKMNRNR